MPGPYIKRVSEVWGEPTLVNGRPVDWIAEDSIIEDWGKLKVKIGGVDVTTYRGVLTQVRSWSTAEPFGYKTAEIGFPQITPFEELPEWLVKFSDVQIILVRPDTTEKILWRGMFADEEDSISETENGMTVQAFGSMFQADLYKKKPKLTEIVAQDLYTILQEELDPDNRSGARWDELVGTITGIEFQQAGSWEFLLTGYIQDLLGRAATEDGDQWTVTIDSDLVPELKLKDRTTMHWNARVGQPGVTHALSRDFTMSPNAFYGEGVDRQMCHWRNTRYPPYGTTGINGPEYPFFQPVIEDTATNKYEKQVADGVIVGLNEDWDNTVVRVESYQNFGSYITREEAADSAAVEFNRRQPRYVGTVTFRTDPQEGSRFEMAAGENLLYLSHRGVAGRSFHIVDCSVDWSALAVTVTVDESAQDYVTVAAIMERDRSTTDPSLRRQRTYRNSRAVRDQKAAEWDCESGAGVIPLTSVPDTTWTVIQVPAGTAGTVINTLMTTDPAAAFAVGVFDRTPPGIMGSPFSDDDFWDGFDDSTGLIMAWGAGTQRAGYYPGTESGEDSITGVLKDDASWYYRSEEPPWLYLAVYSAIETEITGLMRPGADY